MRSKTIIIGIILILLFSSIFPIVNSNVTSSKYIIYEDDNTPPVVNIINPTPGLYLFNQKIMNLPNNIISFGPIDIVAEASDDESGIDYVEYSIVRYPFFIIGRFLDENYTYTLDRFSLGRWHVTIRAYDNAGNKAIDQIEIWKYL